MDVFGDKKTSKNISFFECKICDFKCSKKGDWDRHLTRPKHINLTLGDAIITTNNIYYVFLLSLTITITKIQTNKISRYRYFY